ncbi:MAG: Rne/Rng family ribonuclease [Phycisphaeraceae bacterium]|nr:Rne/Rng family ribonuclease [Phycisphaeraceae bacterium]
MLINYIPGEECRIAVTTDGKLEELYQERESAQSHVGNIYKGRVINVEPSIQAAFIDFGLERNGFLHITDVHPMYFPGQDREEFERVGSKTPHRDRPPIQRCFKRGQEVLVQVLKEGLGTKGPTVTSYLSIPGRFLVMMPHMQRHGVSRKVEDDDTRREMRAILADLNPPADFGFIIRTAGLGQTKSELKRDLAYLQRLWKNIERHRSRCGPVGELYIESDLVIRTIRDIYTPNIERIVADHPDVARRVYDFLSIASPRSRSRVIFYDGKLPLFHRFNVETQIEGIYDRAVPLPSGGSLVIDQTEALVAIDVNSGRSRDARDAETNAFKTNCEAVDEICRQLRLRDLGGVVVNDLIDMNNASNRRKIEQRMRDNLKRDRARTRTASISPFGVLEMTRQRMRPSLRSALTTPCTACGGTGNVKSSESVVLDVMRRLARAMDHDAVVRLELVISPDVAFHLLNRKRGQLVDLEQRFGKQVTVRVGGARVDHVEILAFDQRNAAVNIDAAGDSARHGTDGPQFVEVSRQPLEGESPQLSDDGEMDQDDIDDQAEDEDTAEPQTLAADPGADGPTSGKKRRRRKRRRRKKSAEAGSENTQVSPAAPEPAEPAAAPPPSTEASSASDAAAPDSGAPRKKRRRRGGRRHKKKNPAVQAQSNNQPAASSGYSNAVMQPPAAM